LRPALEAAGALVIYVDLWADRTADPGDVLSSAVRETLASRDGAIRKLVRSTGIESLSLGGVSLSLGGEQTNREVTLTDALVALSDDVGSAIVLILDEAQHAIVSEAGSNALFALKAARDELNSSRHHGLRIVATGSSRDKLAMLRGSKDQAFYGAPLAEFPPLDKGYIDWFIEHLSFANELDAARVLNSFQRAAHRPELLGAAADSLLYDLNAKPGQYAARLDALIDEQIELANDETLRIVRSLTPLQYAVLHELAGKGANYAPFEQATMERYQATLTERAPDMAVVPNPGNVQQALIALQQKSLVWRAARGAYALEDTVLAELMREQGMFD
jgi:hypothetical protein